MPSTNGYLIRRYDPALDLGIESLLSVSYTRSLSAKKEQRDKFIERHKPVWRWLLEHADVTVAVDELAPDTSIWAWLVTSEPNYVHAIGAKRSVIEAGLAVDVVSELLGQRLTREQAITLELPQLRAQRPGWRPSNEFIGLDRPKLWYFDPGFLPSQILA